jgi:hypothetical protein
MKYMIMMFGDAATAIATHDTQWMREMIAWMQGLDEELTASGELVQAVGLTDASTARLVRRSPDGPIATDGPYAESKESVIGFWIVDVAEEQRVLDIAGQIVAWSEVVEVRRVADAPPEL